MIEEKAIGTAIVEGGRNRNIDSDRNGYKNGERMKPLYPHSFPLSLFLLTLPPSLSSLFVSFPLSSLYLYLFLFLLSPHSFSSIIIRNVQALHNISHIHADTHTYKYLTFMLAHTQASHIHAGTHTGKHLTFMLTHIQASISHSCWHT